jgi:hypothetical protein
MASAATNEVVNAVLKRIKDEFRVSTPILAYETPDTAESIKLIQEVCKTKDGADFPLFSWDFIRGIRAVMKPDGSYNVEAQKWLEDYVMRRDEDFAKAVRAAPSKEIRAEMIEGQLSRLYSNPVEALILADKFPKKSKLFFWNAQRFINQEAVMQGVQNLRDRFKSDGRCIFLMGWSVKLPPELFNDVSVISEPLPTPDQLKGIVMSVFESANQGLSKAQKKTIPLPDDATLNRAIDALRGLPAYTAETAVSLNLGVDGLDIEALWETKRRIIEQQPGMTVYRGRDSFDDIGGCNNVKGYLRRVLRGNDPPRAIVFIDEIEKVIGTGYDTSGVSQAQLGALLSYMQDPAGYFGKTTKGRPMRGMIFVGPPGAAKSQVAKAAGNDVKIPTVQFNLSDMKDSLVGASEARLRNALKTVSAVSDDNALFIATCNSLAALPPELQRRFNRGIFFFDLPEPEEQDAIWRIYCKKFGITKEALESFQKSGGSGARPDEGWTGAEIRQASELVADLTMPGNPFKLEEAAKFVVPVAKSAKNIIEDLRRKAHGKFISASYPGPYQWKDFDKSVTGTEEKKEKTGRSIDFTQG